MVVGPSVEFRCGRRQFEAIAECRRH
jgi:hypothetical protein